MKKLNFKIILIALIVLTTLFVPVLECAKAMSYSYDFWKNIIPSAEGIAHQDTYYAENFQYYKNNDYEKVIEKINKYLENNNLNTIKTLIMDVDYKTLTAENYQTAHEEVNASSLTPDEKTKLNDLLDEKKTYEADPNLYKKISFEGITDVEVDGNKIYILVTPSSETKISNVSGTAGVTNVSQLIVINNELEWESCTNEFIITDEVKSLFDSYYKWHRLRLVSVASGENHVIAVDSSGNLWAWGDNTHGQLGLDPSIYSNVDEPYQVTWIGDTNAIVYKSVYASGNTSYAIDDKGAIYSWGSNVNNMLAEESISERFEIKKIPFDKSINNVIVSDDHVYVVDSTNNVFGWGNGNDGLLGAENKEFISTPVKIINVEDNVKYNSAPELKDKPDEKKLATIKSFVAGKNHSAIIDEDGTLWMWGSNEFNQLGITGTEVLEPTRVDIRKNNVKIKVNNVAVGDKHTVIVDIFGSLWAWGSNEQTQLGIAGLANQNTPYLIDEEVDYKSIFAYGNSSFALDTTGHLYVFGDNQNNELGIGNNAQNNVPLTSLNNNIAFNTISSTGDATFGIDMDNRLWIWGNSDNKLGYDSNEDITSPKYQEKEVVLKNIAIKELSSTDIYKRAVYVASSKDENIPSIYLRKAEGVTVVDNSIYIADTENSRILKVNRETFVVEDVCLTPEDSTFKDLSLNSSVTQSSTSRQFKPTKVAVAKTGLIYCIASQVYEGIIEFNKAGNFNRYLGKNEVVVNPIKSALQNFLSEAQLATFSLTLPPLFTNINIDDDGFIYATSYPDADDPTSKNMVKSINTSGKDVMKRNGYVKPDGDAVYLSASTDANAILGSSKLVDVAINSVGNFTVVDEVRGRLFTYDNEGNLLYIAGDQPGGTKQTSSSVLSYNIINPIAIDYLYRSYIDENNQSVEEELIIVADQKSKSLMFYETTEFGKLVNLATATYAKGVDTAEKASAVREIWLKVIKMNTNYELAYLGIGKCLLVESDYVYDKDEQLVLFQEAMKNFKLAHSSIYYSKAYSRYRDQVLKDNFNLIMAGVVIAFIGIVAVTVVSKVKKKNALIKAGKAPVEGDDE